MFPDPPAFGSDPDRSRRPLHRFGGSGSRPRPRRPRHPETRSARPSPEASGLAAWARWDAATDAEGCAARAADDGRLLARAQDELERVHAREVARLLFQAALLLGHRTGEEPWLLSSLEVPPTRAAWRRETRRVLRLGRQDGLSAPGQAELAELLRRPEAAWPAPSLLARAALSSWDGETARLGLGWALLREARHDEAAALFAALLRREGLALRWRALEGLAMAHAARGRNRLALGAIDAAADDPDCGVMTLVGGLYLAWRARDLRRARRAAARLDILVDPREPAFLGALEQLRRSLRSEPARASALGSQRGAERRERNGVLRLCRGLSREDGSPAGRVCRLFLEPLGSA